MLGKTAQNASRKVRRNVAESVVNGLCDHLCFYTKVIMLIRHYLMICCWVVFG